MRCSVIANGDYPVGPPLKRGLWHTRAMRAARILERLGALYAIDRAAGTNRPRLGAGGQRAFDMVAGWMEDAGLHVSVDPAGNLYGRLPGSDPELAEVWSGSHLDTPP